MKNLRLILVSVIAIVHNQINCKSLFPTEDVKFINSQFKEFKNPEISPDVDFESKLTMCEMVAYRGYPCLQYETVTEDGFILTIFRIQHGKSGPNQYSQMANKEPVLLMHGLLDCSFTWINNFPHQSLG